MAGVIALKRWHEISRVYYEALQRPADHRAAFLDDFCAGDDALHLEVASLLDCHSEAG